MQKEKPDSITPEQLKLLKKEISESLSRDRHALLTSQPFIGSIAMHFDLIPVRDKRCLTACTDTKSIYFNTSFYLNSSKEERLFILAHEVWHTVTLTFARKQSRDTELWNIASDMEINNILVNSDRNAFSPPDGLLFPPNDMRGKSAETIYDWLIKQGNKNNQTGKKPGSKSKTGKNGSMSDNSTGSSSGDRSDKKRNGNETGKLEGQFDKHCYENADDETDNQNGYENPRDEFGEIGYDDDFKPSLSPDAAERMREFTVSAAQQYQREHGNLPSGIEGIIEKLVKPEIAWYEYLSAFVSKHFGVSRQYLPPNRRYLHNEMYFQSRRDERLEGVIAIDTSGSCVSLLPKFFSELKGIIDTFPSYKLTVIQADAAVDKVDIYESNENPLQLDTADGIVFSGGGGTDYGPVFKYIDNENINPDFLIYIGDGYADMSYNVKPNYSVMWLLTKDGNENFCDWGLKVKFKESSWD